MKHLEKPPSWKPLALSCLVVLGLTVTLAGQNVTFTPVLSFDNNLLPDPGMFDSGYFGPTPLVQGRDGKLYGTTESGGIPGNINATGTVFKLTPGPPAKLTSLHSFHQNTGDGDGQYPNSGVTLATNGAFYGTTEQGGTNTGIAFKITASGTLSKYNFTNPSQQGDEPAGGLLQAANGLFYGTTSKGGPGGCGTIFKMTAAGVITPLYDFTAGCGGPFGNLIQGTDGNIYGTNWTGGKFNNGWIFKIDPSGNVSDVYDFQGQPNDGANPGAGLLEGSDGNFYGTTCFGGNAPNGGTVFRLTPSGVVTVLVNFGTAAVPGQCPEAPLIQATDGNFYGTTTIGGNLCAASTTCGTIFQLTLGGQYSTLYEFNYSNNNNTGPWRPAGGLVQYTDGTFYGITAMGGSSTNCNAGCGAIYQLIVPGLGPFVVLDPTAAKVGKTVNILGQGFNGTTSVKFNGVAATFSVKTNTYLTATVPSGATTGFVTVTTPGGTVNSNVPFQVLP